MSLINIYTYIMRIIQMRNFFAHVELHKKKLLEKNEIYLFYHISREKKKRNK